MADFMITHSVLLSLLIYLLFPVLTLGVLFLFFKKNLWLTVLIVAGVDLMVWGRALVYNYGEFRGIVLLFLLPQLAVTALLTPCLSFFIKRTGKK